MSSPATSPDTGFAENYNDVLVPVIFRPWARELISIARPEDGDHILDLACGTGAVSREVILSGITPGSLTGVDHSDGMLAVARAQAAKIGFAADWVQADAVHLPFPDNSFGVAFCQQALQFFPDRPAALSELRRVLKPGARVAFCISQDIAINPLLRAQAATLDAYAGQAAGDAVRAICQLPDGLLIGNLFRDAGFQDVSVTSVTLQLQAPDARAFVEGALGGMHTGDKIGGLPPDEREASIQMFLDELGPAAAGGTLNVPHVSNVVSARA